MTFLYYRISRTGESQASIEQKVSEKNFTVSNDAEKKKKNFLSLFSKQSAPSKNTSKRKKSNTKKKSMLEQNKPGTLFSHFTFGKNASNGSTDKKQEVKSLKIQPRPTSKGKKSATQKKTTTTQKKTTPEQNKRSTLFSHHFTSGKNASKGSVENKQQPKGPSIQPRPR